MLSSLRPLLAVVGRGADAGAVPAPLRAFRAPPDPELARAGIGPTDAAATACGPSGPVSVFAALSLHTGAGSLGAELLLFFANCWKLWLPGGRFFGQNLSFLRSGEADFYGEMVLDRCRCFPPIPVSFLGT